MSQLPTIGSVALRALSICIRVTLALLSYLLSLLYEPKRSKLPPITDGILLMPATKLSDQIKKGQLSSHQVVQAFISRIKKVNPIINALVDSRYEQALREAHEIDHLLTEARDGNGDKSILSLPLVGVPVSVKEAIAVTGQSQTAGLSARRSAKADRNAHCVDLLMKNKMIPIGSTNIPELALWWECANPVYGRTLNPFDLSRTPGGSSGGEAALIGSAGSVVGVGSDIAGSIRLPASFCGLFGHKTSPRMVSNDGTYPPVKGDRENLLSLGPICRFGCDLAPMLKAMVGDDNAKQLKLDEPLNLTGLKVFYIRHLGDPLAKACNQDILDGQQEAVDFLVRKFGATAKEINLPDLEAGIRIWSAEANSEQEAASMATLFKEGSNDERLNPVLEFGKKLVHLSDHSLGALLAVFLERFAPQYGTELNTKLRNKAASLRQTFNELVGDQGVLILPTHPEPAPNHHLSLLKIFNVSYTFGVTVLHAPITQCPLGLTKEGLPYGVQIVAKPLNDRLTMRVAEELGNEFGGWQAPCRVVF